MNSASPRYKHWLAYLAVTLFYCRKMFLGYLLLPLGGDEVHSIYSSMVYLHDWTKGGTFPLWNTLSACGAPFAAGSITLANFYYLTARFLEAGTAYNTVIFTSILLNGILLYEFLLRKNCSPYAAWIGGLVWMISTASAIDSGFFFLSLSFLLAELYSSKNSRIFYVLLAGSLGLYACNAHPQFFLYNGLFLFFYLISKRTELSRIFVISVPVLFITAFGLAGFHWSRLAEWILLSNRSDWTLAQAWLPTHYPLVIFPKLYHLASRQDLDFIVPRIFQWFFSRIHSLRSLERVLEPPYMGLWPLLGIFVAVHQAKQQKQESSNFFLMASAFTVFYLLFHPLLYLTVIRHIPVLSGMTNIGRLFDVYQFSLAVLTAKAVDFLLRHGERPLGVIRNAAKCLTAALGVFFIALWWGRVFILKHEAIIRQKIESNLHALSVPNIFIDNLSELKNRRTQEFFFFIRESISFANPHLLFPAILIAVLLGMVYAYQTHRISKRSFQWLVVLFVLADLGTGLGFGLSSSARQELRQSPGVVRFLKEDHELYRVMMVEDKTKSFNSFFLVPQSNMIYGLATPDGYEPLYVKRYADFYTWLTKRSSPLGFVMHPMHDFNEDLANFINVKYFVTSKYNDKLERNSDYEKVYEGEGYRVYQNKHAMPRAFFVHEVRSVKDVGEAENYIRAFPERLKKEVVLIGERSNSMTLSLRDGRSDHVDVQVYEPNRIKIKAESETGGYLVISDTYYPGWEARLDGKKEPILLADYAFRAVRVPEGTHYLALSYKPSSLRLGLTISTGAVLVLLIVSKIIT